MKLASFVPATGGTEDKKADQKNETSEKTGLFLFCLLFVLFIVCLFCLFCLFYLFCFFVCFICFVYFVCFVCFVCFVFLFVLFEKHCAFISCHKNVNPVIEKKKKTAAMINKFRQEGDANICVVCNKTVYATEKIIVDDKDQKKLLHKNCLRCAHCQKPLGQIFSTFCYVTRFEFFQSLFVLILILSCFIFVGFILFFFLLCVMLTFSKKKKKIIFFD